MAAVAPDEPLVVRCDSPPPDTAPMRALGASSDMSRCLSTASSVSHASATTDASHMRDSLGSEFSAFSRQSSGSYQSSRLSDMSSSGHVLRSRVSTSSLDTVNSRSGGGASKRRGYMRPQGTDFAASARSRESVLSLGSITHLQYYFARTGLLDGKGGQLARKRQLKGQTLDLSALDTSSFLTAKPSGSDHDSSYASMGSSPDLAAHAGFGGVSLGGGGIVESPIEEHHPDQQDEEYFSDDFDEPDPHMLPPTASTYNYREKPLPRPPSVGELKSDLADALKTAVKALNEARETKVPSPEQTSPSNSPKASSGTSPGWHEIQGVHILDVMTLAIRAAKIYYTSHDRPDRLDSIKSEKQIRGELLSVMDVLKRMATRGFVGGMRSDEFRTMDAWIAGLRAMLATEDAIEAAEAVERASWTWLRPDGWEGREFAREEAFMQSMLEGSADPVDSMSPLPKWTPIDRALPLTEQSLPTPFLASLQNGLRLVQLHNCAVRKSRRKFGAIPTFHTDTQKPYRAADNLRYWVKAAELRWEVLLKIDALGLQYNNNPALWVELEDAVLHWCRKVREEIASELQG
ncbi:hypothetical protein B0T26DRAFT_631461 [Lasiosphaeria miniovina]|uniref:Uncharacterized protein n=1 Tax=Lasiosphaeria miniovina TaxID=1954250 RepID=A0AA40BFV7_9PEZI|nr:uncharacterized protein B0T26DRAFT_631461 [Lasiosphaeria miniovina]KAK0733487.1 hypothetical protein B0T26DRAFT_631461 [Lasiosphaeria miniovina]